MEPEDHNNSKTKPETLEGNQHVQSQWTLMAKINRVQCRRRCPPAASYMRPGGNNKTGHPQVLPMTPLVASLVSVVMPQGRVKHAGF